MKSREPVMVYQIKVTLKDIQPPIWRRIRVSDKITLIDLHDVIQDVFTWLDYHLHEFTIHNVHYGDPANDETGDRSIQDEQNIKLKALNLVKGDRFTYEYDFGDSWIHTLLVEKVFPIEKGMKLPQCIGGKRARPPEDVGGPGGYEFFLEAIRNPRHPEHTNFLHWAGEDFDPEAFNMDAIDERLQLRLHKDWFGRLPSQVEDAMVEQQPFTIPSRWAKLLNEESKKTAQALPLRRDVVTLVTYLKENKVTGTKSTGNLPLKIIEDVASRFVNPPPLETGSGDLIYRLRSEEEVWPVYFAHVLAQGANLISGGPGQRWRLTSTGEEFLTMPEVGQVWLLFIVWWYQINWLIAYPYRIFERDLPDYFRQRVYSFLRELPMDQPILFEPFADRLIEEVSPSRRKMETEYSAMFDRTAIEHWVINPLEDLGVLSTRREIETERYLNIEKLVSFSLTIFGRELLELLAAG